MRPLLKDATRWQEDGAVRLVSDGGADVLLPDPDGFVARLLDLLDGTRTLDELAGALPQTERVAVVLRYGYDLDYEQIGAAIGSSAEAARQAASSGVRRLRRKELS